MKKIKITKEQFNRVTNLLKEEFPKLKKNIVDKTFQQEFANKNIKNLEEDTDFRIQKDINVNGVNPKTMGKFMKESTGDLKQETLDFINYLYNKNEDLPSYDEICKELESKGILTNVDGKFKLSKSLGSAEEAKKILDDEISNMMGGDKEVAGELDEEEQIQQISFAVVVFNREMAILEGSDGEYYCFYYHEYIDEILEPVAAEKIGAEKHVEPVGDGESDVEVNYTYADKEITEEALQDYINKNRNKLTIGNGDEGYTDGLDINKIFHGEYCTTFINFLARKCVCEDNSENLKLFQFAIDNGADCSKSNFLQNISGVQYENRQYRKDFVKFLIDRNLIDTTNHIIFENKMLYDTRLGKCILELKNIIP